MKEKLITLETAKLAKEKGFDESTVGFYLKRELIVANPIINKRFVDPLEDIIEAPTQSLLQKWLREKNNVHIQVHFINNSYLIKIKYFEKESIMDLNIKKYLHKTYEEALEKGLQEALKLI